MAKNQKTDRKVELVSYPYNAKYAMAGDKTSFNDSSAWKWGLGRGGERETTVNTLQRRRDNSVEKIVVRKVE
jgi:hypothetical protein